MKNFKTVILNIARNLGGVGLAVLLFVVGLQAGEVRFTLDGGGFVNDTLSNGQRFEAFRFDLPEIPQGARIDFAGLVLHIDRSPVDSKDTLATTQMPLALVSITTDWTPASIENGQVVSVDKDFSSYAVADYVMGDKVELDITHLVSDWLAGKKANKGFMLVPEFSEEKTEFAVKSNVGVKVEVVIYYTGPEIVKE